MFKVQVERVIDKDIESVFEIITDHESYTRFKGIDEAKLLEQGHKEKNGEGALRLIGSGSNKLFERITYFDRPNRMDYRIERSKPLPMRHDKGEITLTAVGDKTKVIWISHGHITIPILGGLLLDGWVEKQVNRMFSSMLKMVENV